MSPPRPRSNPNDTPPFFHRRRGPGPGRPMKHRIIHTEITEVRYFPHPRFLTSEKDPIRIAPDELEALRLIDIENLSQEEAGTRMGVSRGTIWRILKRAREKIMTAFLEHRVIILESVQQETTPKKSM